MGMHRDHLNGRDGLVTYLDLRMISVLLCRRVVLSVMLNGPSTEVSCAGCYDREDRLLEKARAGRAK